MAHLRISSREGNRSIDKVDEEVMSREKRLKKLYTSEPRIYTKEEIKLYEEKLNAKRNL